MTELQGVTGSSFVKWNASSAMATKQHVRDLLSLGAEQDMHGPAGVVSSFLAQVGWMHCALHPGILFPKAGINKETRDGQLAIKQTTQR